MKQQKQKEHRYQQSKGQLRNAKNLVNVIVQNGYAREHHERLTEAEAKRLLNRYPDTSWIEGSEEEIQTNNFQE